MTEKQRICSFSRNGLNESDRTEIARLLIKAGYTVRVGRAKNAKGVTEAFVEYWKEENA